MGVSSAMSNFVKRGSDPDPRVKFLSVALAVVLALFWGALIAGIWWFFDTRENTFAGGILNWVSRFHVLLVHLPVGMIFLVIALELFGKLPGFHHIREATVFTLWLSLLGAILATLLGFLLMEVEDVSGKAMTYHLWTGLAVVVLSLLALIFKIRGHGFIYGITLLACAFSISAAGHYGGAMVHGSDYLSKHAPEYVKPVMLAGLSDAHAGEEIPDAEEVVEVKMEDKNVYSTYIHPILEKSCNECHNENKIKGKLRMDTHELLMAGADGSDYPTVVPGDPNESELIVRVTLPKDNDEFMPPKGDGLTDDEIKLLELWINAGAGTDLTVAQLGDDPSIFTTVTAVDATFSEDFAAVVDEVNQPTLEAIWNTLSEEEREARIAAVQTEAERLNISVMPVSAEDSRLRVNVLNGADGFGDEQIAMFEPVAERIVWLNLAKSQITDEGLKTVGKMIGLEKLHLENTPITDAGIAHLSALSRLEYLNLYDTKVTNQIFDTMKKMSSLRKVYVWQTDVDPEEARRFEESVNLEVNTGIDLEVAAAEAKALKEAEEAAKMAEEAAKKEAEAKKKAAEDAKKKAALAVKKMADEEAARKKAVEEAAKQKAAAEAAAKKAAAEALRKKAADEAARANPATPESATPAPAPQ